MTKKLVALSEALKALKVKDMGPVVQALPEL